jgi:hypothetical protein
MAGHPHQRVTVQSKTQQDPNQVALTLLQSRPQLFDVPCHSHLLCVTKGWQSALLPAVMQVQTVHRALRMHIAAGPLPAGAEGLRLGVLLRGAAGG